MSTTPALTESLCMLVFTKMAICAFSYIKPGELAPLEVHSYRDRQDGWLGLLFWLQQFATLPRAGTVLAWELRQANWYGHPRYERRR